MDWLDEFQQVLEGKFPQIAQTLQNRFENSSHFDRLEMELGTELPTDLSKFYQKWDGQGADTEYSIQFGFRVLSIQEIIDMRASMSEKWASRPAEENWWNSSWIPWLSDDEGGLVVVDCEGCFQGQKGQIIELFEDWDERNIEYPSLESFIKTFTTSLNKDMWIEEEGSLLPKEDEEWQDLSESLNPGFPIEEFAGPRSGFDA